MKSKKVNRKKKKKEPEYGSPAYKAKLHRYKLLRRGAAARERAEQLRKDAAPLIRAAVAKALAEAEAAAEKRSPWGWTTKKPLKRK